MTDEQIHLYAVARTVVPIGTRLSTLAEPVHVDSPFPGGTLYTLILQPEGGGHRRWFAIHSGALRGLDDHRLRLELAAAIERNARSPRAFVHPPA